MIKTRCFLLLAWIAGLLSAWAQADNNPVAQLKVFENVDAQRAELRVRLREPLEITKIEATADGKALPVTYQPFGEEGHADTCSLLFLIDKSDPKRAKTIEAAKTLTLQLLERSAPHTECAVYAFDANLDLVADFGAPYAEVATNLKKVKAIGLATELYRAAIEAIAILEKRPVERRGLVLLSDGKAEDTTYSLEKVVEAASKAGVAIFTVGYAESPQSTIYLQSLRRLAAETGGLFAEAEARTRQVPADFLDGVPALLRSGGFATVDLAENQTAKEVQLTFQAEGHEPFQQAFALVKLAPAIPEPKVAEVASKVAEMAQTVAEVSKQMADVPGKVEEAAKKAEEDRKAEEAKAAELAKEQDAQAAREAARKNSRLIFGSVLVSLLLIAVVLFLVISKRRKDAANAAAAPIFARLQVLDGDGTEVLMRTTALRVGRGKDNDLTLGNDSVSRHHAEISRTREGAFTITELNSGNGVLVNGQSVEKATLQNEDIIELGEVRIRFLVA